jgi:predicted O-methyltransferase YrrM
MYGRGDAAILSAVIRELRPRRIIEVGSGFSSACALDTVDDLNVETSFTFIEPYPEARLHGLLRTNDHSHVTIHAKGVQDIDLSVFDELESGDLLFLDTTHVSKTGSDVNHELFQILPRLRSGVIIHFHDVFWGWEYPVEWVQENRSWNELYLLRAFLMHNDAYSILMFNDMMYQLYREKVLAASPSFRGPYGTGAGLYLRKR